MSNEKEITDFLFDVRNAKIVEGLKIGIPEVDEHFRYKQAQLNFVLGHDNVGKTFWLLWYFLVLSSQYGKKWVVWCDENHQGQIVLDLIQQYSGRDFMSLTENEIHKYKLKILSWFTFVDNKKQYTLTELLAVFKGVECDGCLIDPYTGLKRGFGFSDNYEAMNIAKQWIKETGKTLYICLHTISDAGRAGSIYAKGHPHEGCIKPPRKADAEGGQVFANRADDFFVAHRFPQKDSMRFFTQIHVLKIKNTRTGGQPTLQDLPVLFDYNFGRGFKIGGIDPIYRPNMKTIEQQKIDFNEAKRVAMNNSILTPEKSDFEPQKALESEFIDEFTKPNNDLPF